MLNLQSMLPKAMKAQEENSDARLKELNAELKSLKTLIANRMGGGVPTSKPEGGNAAAATNGAASYGEQGRNSASASGTSTPVSGDAPVAVSSDRGSLSHYGRFSAGKGNIGSMFHVVLPIEGLRSVMLTIPQFQHGRSRRTKRKRPQERIQARAALSRRPTAPRHNNSNYCFKLASARSYAAIPPCPLAGTE